MGLLDNCVNQVRKPKGFLGKMMIKGMNIGHAKMADWGLNHLKTITPEEIVDLGCGFSKVRIFHHKSKPWIAVLVRK